MKAHNIQIVIQARLSSSRLPAKALLPLGNIPSVVLCALRAKNTGLAVSVATSTDTTDDIICSTLDNWGINYYRGSLNDVLNRMCEATSKLQDDDLVVRLTADNVFPDGVFISAMLDEFDSENFDYISSSSSKSLPYGMSVEIFKVSGIRKANQEVTSSFDREHVTPFIKRNNREQISNLSFPWQDASHLRCTLDTFEDYITLFKLFAQIKVPETISWDSLVDDLVSLCYSRKARENREKLDKFILGTAQLGMKYGIANKKDILNEQQVNQLFYTATNMGIRYLDTARVYGLSEHRIGNFIKNNLNTVSAVTKLHTLDFLASNANTQTVEYVVRASVLESCRQLRVSQLPTILLHRAKHLLDWNGVVLKQLLEMRSEGLIRNIGVSISSPEELLLSLSVEQINYIQLPLNLVDWRWWNYEVETMLVNRKDVYFAVRSVFLQGLLLMRENEWPDFFSNYKVNINNSLDDLVNRFNRKNRQDLCLAYVRGLSWVNGIVLGVNNIEQLLENVGLFLAEPLTKKQMMELRAMIPKLPENILNPAMWEN